MSTWQVHPEEFLGRYPWKVRPDDFLKQQPAEEPRKFSSTQVNLPESLASKVRALAQRIPDHHLAEDGRENEIHATVKYGLHSNDPEPVRNALQGEGPVNIRLGKTSIFPAKQEDIQRGGADVADVVKIDVDSPDLHRLNKKIADANPHTDTHPVYHPHVTLAYVKPGLGKQYEGMPDLDGETATINSLRFSGKDKQVTDIPLNSAPQSVPTSQTVPNPQLAPTNATEGRQTSNLGPIPESPKALKLQLAQLVTGNRQAVMFSPGEEIPAKPEGLNELKTKVGTFYYDPEEIGARAIKRAIKFNRLNDILGDKQLGYGAPPKQELQPPIVSVVGKANDGTDIQATATDHKNLPETIEAHSRVAPQVHVTHPQEAVAKRVLDSANQGVEINRGSSTEIPLSPEGVQEAKETAAKIGPVDSLATSDSVRAEQTAAEIAKNNPQVPMQPKKNLESWAQGDLEGRPAEEVKSQIKGLIDNAKAVPAGIGPFTSRPGESFNAFKQRLLPEMANEMDSWLANPSRKALVLHSQGIKTFKAWLALGMPEDLAVNKQVLRQSSGETGGVEQLRYDGNKWSVSKRPNYKDPTGFYLVRHGHTPLNT